MAQDLDYIFVLKAIQEIPFGVGKKLLADFLAGNIKNESIARNKLNKLESFGSLAYDLNEVSAIVDRLLLNKLVKSVSVQGKSFWKILELTPEGEEEIINPVLYKKKLANHAKEYTTKITSKDKSLFKALDSFLSTYNDDQKKAIISDNEHILCIAGAGSGKTTVLTKRIEFLTKYRSIDPSKVLAITFTRKARQEMVSRVSKFDIQNKIQIETFNSFCEKMLKKHNDLIYDKEVKVLSYRDKIVIVNKALMAMNLNMKRAVAVYFTYSQRMGKSDEQLANIFMNDCFFIRDYFKFKNMVLEESSFDKADSKHVESSALVFKVCKYIDSYMLKHGLRDFADQLLDTIELFHKHPSLIPNFEHILIDEFQDVNSTQIEFVDLLNSKNVFAVGDPRQSIFGWRGSDIKYILNFEEKYPGCEIVSLVMNYRSSESIVSFMNKAISSLGLNDIQSSVKGEKDISLLKMPNERSEFDFVVSNIVSSKVPRKEIFVLARTNKQLNELSKVLENHLISHVVKTDEVKRNIVAGEGDVTLATIHAIKGLEADTVFIVGCNGANFPCKGSEHPVIDLVKVEEYDKEEEEKRLFYVAISRAKKTLFLTYSGSRPTSFITPEMMTVLKEEKVNLNFSKNISLEQKLRDWRRDVAGDLNIPAYLVLHDKTIIDLATIKPQSKSELESIHGFGPSKIMKFGDQILDIILG
jgi:superfamily I DNA/RNA helicase